MNLIRKLAVEIFLAALCVQGADAFDPPVQVPSTADLYARLRGSHPSLLMTEEQFLALRNNIKNSQTLILWRDRILRQAERILEEQPSRYEIPDGLRLLGTSRNVLDRAYTLSLAFWLTEDKRYIDRLWAELQAAGNFPDWNPKHFLDTAEMTHAFAIAYDWLYKQWTADQRRFIADSIIKHGLVPARDCYSSSSRFGWWVRANHNWNQVCNGGIGMGILALAHEAPEWVKPMLRDGMVSIQRAMVQYGPDGAWAEGPGYWNYATSYNVVYLAALQSALGSLFGLDQITGFDQCGWFPIYVTGPSSRTFNYADAGDRPPAAPHLFWLAAHFKQPAFAMYQKGRAFGHALDLIWYRAADWDGLLSVPKQLDRYFRNAEVVTMRGSWNDPDTSFLAAKAGDNKANHSHLDIGTFVFDALGKRWACDLGADDYNLPGYFGRLRWTYYRLRAEGHNTLVIRPLDQSSNSNEADQDPQAASKIVAVTLNTASPMAQADLTPAYARWATDVRRSWTLIDRRNLRLTDEVQTRQAAELWWFMHTRAAIHIDKDQRTAILTQDGATLECRLMAPAFAHWLIMEAKPLPSSPNPDRQAANNGYRKLAIRIPVEKAQRVTIEVELAPIVKGGKG